MLCISPDLREILQRFVLGERCCSLVPGSDRRGEALLGSFRVALSPHQGEEEDGEGDTDHRQEEKLQHRNRDDQQHRPDGGGPGDHHDLRHDQPQS